MHGVHLRGTEPVISGNVGFSILFSFFLSVWFPSPCRRLSRPQTTIEPLTFRAVLCPVRLPELTITRSVQSILLCILLVGAIPRKTLPQFKPQFYCERHFSISEEGQHSKGRGSCCVFNDPPFDGDTLRGLSKLYVP